MSLIPVDFSLVATDAFTPAIVKVLDDFGRRAVERDGVPFAVDDKTYAGLERIGCDMQNFRRK